MSNSEFNIPKGKFSFRPPNAAERAWLERQNRSAFPSWTATLLTGPALLGILALMSGWFAA